jgi:hypothetical protein
MEAQCPLPRRILIFQYRLEKFQASHRYYDSKFLKENFLKKNGMFSYFSNLRRVVNKVDFLLGISQASEY